MKEKVILFDLDGTLLPMDEDLFTRFYFKRLAVKAAPYGYEASSLIDGIWAGTAAMMKNDGSVTNEDAFWTCFAGMFGEKVYGDKAVFEEFYQNEFQEAQTVCGQNPLAVSLVQDLKKAGYRVTLATNPIFPQVATMSRIRWAGLAAEDFEFVTTYEDWVHAKPNPAYYLDVAKKLGVQPEQCIMIGNNVEEDMEAAGSVGMTVFLLTDCLINRKERDIEKYPHGDFRSLRTFLGMDL